jgi:ankyrin repeat protein
MTHEQALKLVKETRIAWPTHDDSQVDEVKKIFKQHPEMVEALNSLDPTKMDETPQGAASHMGCVKILKFLLKQGVKLDVFMAVALDMTDDVIQQLEANPSLVTAKGAHGIALLSHVRSVKMAELLVAHGANPKADGPLNTAVWNGRTGLVKWYLAHGAKVNSKTDGTKALHIAVARGYKDMVELLLAHGAHVNAKGNENKTWGGKRPLTLAMEKGHTEIAELLRQHGAVE